MIPCLRFQEINCLKGQKKSISVYKSWASDKTTHYTLSLYSLYYVDFSFELVWTLDQGIHKVNLKVARNEKRKKLSLYI